MTTSPWNGRSLPGRCTKTHTRAAELLSGTQEASPGAGDARTRREQSLLRMFAELAREITGGKGALTVWLTYALSSR